jgi:hypothetical protein
MRRDRTMTRDIPPLPWTEPARLFYVGALFAAAVAASAVVGIVGVLTRSWPETFTTDPAGQQAVSTPVAMALPSVRTNRSVPESRSALKPHTAAREANHA